MNGFNPTQKTGNSVWLPIPGAQTATTAPSAGNQNSGGFLHHLWEVVNPLEHLPVISTLYRAATGEHIGTFEKIAGDTLYGGVWGALSSVADTVFEAVTGKDIGDTVLSLFTSPHDGGVKTVAMAAPQPVTQSASQTAMPGPDVAALSASLSARGVDGEMARRALVAYQKSLITPMALPNAAQLN